MKLSKAVVVMAAVLLQGAALAQGTSGRAVARDRMQDAAKELKMVGQEAQQSSRYWTDVGRRFYEDYKFELALTALKRAVNYDPSNDEARKLLVQVQAKLGDRVAMTEDYMTKITKARLARIEESIVELNNYIDLSEKYYDRAVSPTEEDIAGKTRDEILARALKNLDVAREHAARARDVLRWLPFKVDTVRYQQRVKDLTDRIASARTDKEAALDAESREIARAQAERRRRYERQAEEDKVRKLLDQAKMFSEQLEFKKAERIAREVLEIDPNNSAAENRLWQARESFARRRAEKIRKERIEQKKDLKERLDTATVPYSAYIIYPDDWDEIRRRESVSARETEEPQWKREIRRKMDRQVAFEFVDTPLTEAVSFLQALTEVNIIIDPKALEEIGGEMNITLRVSDMPLHLALKWILRLAGLDYTLKNEAVFISTPQELAGEVDLRVYDVRDLTSHVTDFSAPEMIVGLDTGAGAGGGMGGIGLEGAGEETGPMAASALADIIRDHIARHTWDPSLGTSIEDRGGKLVVMQRPEVHTLIAQLLRSFRESQTLQVLVEAKFIEVRDSFLEDIGVDWTDIVPEDIRAMPGSIQDRMSPDHPIYSWPGGMPDTYDNFGFYNIDDHEGGGGAGYDSTADSYKEIGGKATFFNDYLTPFNTRLGAAEDWGTGTGAQLAFRYSESDAFQAQAILHALKKEEKGDLLMAPRLMMYNNQRAYVLFARQRGYVADYDISGGIYDPVIKTILTGTILEVKPTVSHDRRYITLELKPSTASRLEFVWPPPRLQSGGLIDLPIYLPIIQLRSVRATVTLPDGGTILLSGLMTETKHQAHSGIPVLSDLPIIGRLFGTDLKQDERMNLLIMVKVKLILFEEEERKL